MADIYLPTLHDGQLKVWSDSLDGQLHAVRCGRRWGKTFMLSSAAVTYATAPFKRPGMDIELGGRVGIFTAEYRQYQEIYDKLEEILLPLKKSFSRQEKRLLLKNGGKIDFWVTNDNKLAGRGREYEIILIDEAAFTKSPEMLREIWPKSIKPTLLTTKGRAYVFSTPDGVDEDNFFYAICHDKNLGFIEHHAPTSSNPFVPPEELEKERANNDPRVFSQEFMAEFVDWSAASLFDVRKWFEGENQDKPVEYPEMCQAVFAVMDTGAMTKLVTLSALQAVLQAHANLGGTYIVATPSIIYNNCILKTVKDSSAGNDPLPQRSWLWDFEQPLISETAADQAVNSFLSKIDGGDQNNSSAWTNTVSALGNTSLGGSVTEAITGVIGKLQGVFGI